MKDYKDYHVGIIGSGLIGAGWATHLLIHGVREITLYDTAPQALDRAKGLISQGLAFFEENGAITAAQRAELEGLPVYTTVMRAAVEGADLILENGSLLAERRFGTGLTVSEIDLEKLEHERQRMNTFPAAAEVYPVYFELEEGETALTRYIDPNPFVPADRGDREARCAEILRLSAQGLAKRLKHTNAKTAVVGLSGGLDSTLAILITAPLGAIGMDASYRRLLEKQGSR